MLSEIFGFLGIFMNVIIYQQKDRRKLLRCKWLSDIPWVVHYSLAGNFSGAAVGGLAFLREGIFLVLADRKINRKPLLVFFLICAGIAAVLTWKGWISLLPATASVISVISFWQQSAKRTRMLVIPISLCMMFYDIQVGSIAGFCNEVLTIGSSVIGLRRHDK